MSLQRIFVLLVALAAFGITTSLGFWQLSRAGQKEALARQMEERRQLPALVLNGGEVVNQSELWADRPASLRGQWLTHRTIYLDNRQMNGHPGFYVMTPLRLEGASSSVMVQRGWVPRSFQDRTALPQIDTPTGLVVIQGRIATHSAKLLELGKGPVSQIRQNLDLNTYAQEIGERLLPFIVLQTGPDSDGLKRQWPAVDAGVDKHYGYAFQWFGLSALWVILYVWFQIIVPRKKRASA
jgi:surfeit locus 1 family protein